MPVNFLSQAQREQYGCYTDMPMPDDMDRCFHLDEGSLQEKDRKVR